MTGRRLRVRTRHEPLPGQSNENWTLFARLAPPTAQSLHDAAGPEPSDETKGAGWSISQSCSPPDFLPLKINGIDYGIVYLSYNGGAIAEEDCIEVAAGLLPQDVTHLTVTPMSFLQDAVSIEVEPLTTSDWESLEVYAELLEGGELLQQVCVVYPNQILSLRAADTMVHVKVVRCSHKVCRLVADTEVHVRPKPRPSPHKSVLLRAVPVWDDFGTDMQDLCKTLSEEAEPIQVKPCTVLLHPSILKKCGLESGSIVVCWKRSKDDGDESDAEIIKAVARVQASTRISAGSVALHTLLRYQLGVTPLYDHVRLQAFNHFEPATAMDMVKRHALSLSLERVELADSPVDHEQPWLYPSNDISHRRPTLARTTPKDIPYLTQLRSMLASWLDLDEADKQLPLCPGSLIWLPWVQEPSDQQQLYRLVAHPSDELCSDEPICMLAKDLPDLLLTSNNTLRQDKGKPREHEADNCLLPVSDKDQWLNMLPPTMDLSTPLSVDLASALSRDLECYDGIMMTGELGSGKTHLSLILAARARLSKGFSTLYLDCKRLQSSSDIRMKDILLILTRLFRQATECKPCFIILDDLDELVPNVNMGGGEGEGSAHQQQPNPVAVDQAKLIADHLYNLMKENTKEDNGSAGHIFVLVTCRDEQSFHPLITAHWLFRTVQMPSYDAIEREQLFLRMLRSVSPQEPWVANVVALPGFGSKTEGSRPRDLEVFATRVNHSTKMSTGDGAEKAIEAIDKLLIDFVPIVRQGIHVEDTVSCITWSQVGGLFSVKEQLASSILHPVKYRRIYDHSPVQLPHGILLFGYPGCGKSFLLPALAQECGLTLITCRGPELLSKFIGESEAKVRQLFQRAFAAAPSLLFMDEFDALAPLRGSDHTGVTDRVVNQLLTYLDGVEDTTAGSVYIVAATSRPDKVDPALLRPGRLEQHVYVGFPSSQEEWHSILEQVLVDRAIDSELQNVLYSRKLWDIERTDHIRHFSPADLKAVVDTAYLNAVHEYLASRDAAAATDEEDVTITIGLRHIVEALQSTRPSLSKEDKRMLSHIYSSYTNNVLDENAEHSDEPKKLRTALR